jgi:hypothetical protein
MIGSRRIRRAKLAGAVLVVLPLACATGSDESDQPTGQASGSTSTGAAAGPSSASAGGSAGSGGIGAGASVGGSGGASQGSGGTGGASASSTTASTGQGGGCVDNDGDGWTTCDGDCCDAISLACAEPSLVNPGAYEALGNGVDDDCDPATDDVTVVTCSVPTLSPPTSADNLVKAMDLCQTTTEDPPLSQKKWGVISAELMKADGTSVAPKDIQVGVLSGYGTAVSPKVGANMAAMSSGTARDATDLGWEDPQNPMPSAGWNGGSSGNPPADYLAAHGGQLPAPAGCMAGSGANDSSNLKVRIRVPTNAKSFSYQFKFYTAEYPEWVCTKYNDFFLALLSSGASGIPADKNISFDANGNAVSVNNAFFTVCKPQGANLCPDGVAELAGTGMATNTGFDGGATAWLTTDAPVVPGETIEVRFIIWDTGDHWYDSLVLLDNFHWSLTPSSVGTHL